MDFAVLIDCSISSSRKYSRDLPQAAALRYSTSAFLGRRKLSVFRESVLSLTMALPRIFCLAILKIIPFKNPITE
jgi:hypothetical protein